MISLYIQLADPVYEELRNGCSGFSDLIVEPRALLVDGNPDENPVALQSTIILSGPASIQESFLRYQNVSYSISEVEQMLDTWKDNFFQVIILVIIDTLKLICCFYYLLSWW